MSLVAQLRSMVENMPPGAGVSLPADWLRSQLEAEESPADDRGEMEPRGDLDVHAIAELAGRNPSTVRGWFYQGLFAPDAYKQNGVDWRLPRAAWDAAQERIRKGTFYPKRESAKAGQAKPARLDGWRDELPKGKGRRRRRTERKQS